MEQLKSLFTKGIRIRKNDDGSLIISFSATAKEVMLRDMKDIYRRMQMDMSVEHNVFKKVLQMAQHLDSVKCGDLNVDTYRK